MSGLDFQVARIQQRRKQLEIARSTGIHPTRLSKIENGWEEPRAEEIFALREALGLSRLESAGEAGEPTQSSQR